MLKKIIVFLSINLGIWLFDGNLLSNVIVAFDQEVSKSMNCCLGIRGNVDNDPEDICDISDLVYLVDFMFTSGLTPVCLEEANVDGDIGNIIDISDLVYLVDFMFTDGPAPKECSPLIEAVLEIPNGTPVIIDGMLSAGEWSDAVLKHIIIDGQIDIIVLVKHDSNNLLVAYYYNFVQTGNLCFPEILLDTEDNKSENWMSDDWWFHVSGTDCEANGTYDVWNDCNVNQSDWEGVPNFAMIQDPPILDTFEIRIPLTKVDIVTGDTIGVAFRAEYVPNLYGYWPHNVQVESPSTWGTAVLVP